MSAEPIPHEALLRHAGFLRRLACDLLGDHAAADDAVQEVWLRALEKPPRHDTNVRGWLRVVLTNLVRSKARGESRRELRERARAHHEADPPASASSSEDEALLRAVTESVLALEEPLRSTVLQHYFQGLTTAEIAQREHLPVSTVKSRLQRALEILRGRMKREGGDSWQASLLALARPERSLHWAPHVVPVAKAGTGVLLMTLKTKLALGGAAVLLAWLLFHQIASAPAHDPSESVANSGLPSNAGTARDALASKEPTLDLESNRNERSAGVSVDRAESAMHAARPATLFYGTLLDPDGKPIHGARAAWVSLTDASGRRRNSDAKDEGAFALHSVPFGKYWVWCYADGSRMVEDVVELSAEHPQIQRDYTLPRQVVLRIRATTPDGKELTSELAERRGRRSGNILVPVATLTPPGEWFSEVVGSLNNPFGVGHFWSEGPRSQRLPPGYMGVVLLDADPPLYVSLLNYHAVLQTRQVQPGDTEVNFVLRPEDVLASAAALRVQVIDADTQSPLADAHVVLSHDGDENGSAVSGRDGVALLENGVPCVCTLVVRAKDHAIYSAPISAKPGVVTDAGQVVLERGLTLGIQALGPDGKPAEASLCVESMATGSSQPWLDGYASFRSASDGKLEIEALGRQLYLLHGSNLDAVNDQDREEVKLVAGNVLVDLRSGVAPKGLEVRLRPASSLALVVIGERADGLRFRVIDDQRLQLVSGRMWGNAPRPLSLPPGNYRVELLDRAGVLLSTKSVTLGAEPVTLELSR